MSSDESKSGTVLLPGKIHDSAGGLPAEFDDAGRAKYSVDASTRDCGVRAVTIVTGRDYLEVRDGIIADLRRRKIGEKSESVKTALSDKTILRALGSDWEYREEPHTFQIDILHKAETNTLIVFIDDHFSAIVNGTIRDTRDHSGADVHIQGYFRRVSSN